MRNARIRFAAIAAVMVLSIAARADTRRFMWAEAQTRMSQARTPDDFEVAADVYAELVEDGVRGGPLFYNLGTARLLADDATGAADALLRAERYMGTTPEIRRNLMKALAARSDADGAASLPWSRVPFFWHYALPCPVRAWVLAVAFSGIWMAFALRMIGAKRLAQSVGTIMLIVAVIAGSSVGASLHADATSERREALRGEQQQAVQPKPTAAHAGAHAGARPGREGVRE